MNVGLSVGNSVGSIDGFAVGLLEINVGAILGAHLNGQAKSAPGTPQSKRESWQNNGSPCDGDEDGTLVTGDAEVNSVVVPSVVEIYGELDGREVSGRSGLIDGACDGNDLQVLGHASNAPSALQSKKGSKQNGGSVGPVSDAVCVVVDPVVGLDVGSVVGNSVNSTGETVGYKVSTDVTVVSVTNVAPFPHVIGHAIVAPGTLH